MIYKNTYSSKGLKVVFFLLLFSFCFVFNSYGKSIIIPVDVLNYDAQLNGVQPGDTLLLEAGKRKSMRISNLTGDSLHQIIVSNTGDEVIIENDNWHYGFVMSNCKFFRLTGSIDNTLKYGIRILKTGKGANGLGIGELSTNYEVDHIEIANTGFAGIFALSQPTCDLTANRGNFVQYDVKIRDNYIHDTFGEGMYLGHSFYTGYTITCNDANLKVYPHEIKGLSVYNNIIRNAGYDGIQVCSAVDSTEIYGNIITNYGTANLEMQHSGIQIGAGAKVRCYNNTILRGSGTGIMMFGMAGSYIYNNLIVDAGLNFYPEDESLRIYGIFVDDRFKGSESSIYIINNSIINTKSEGIRFFSTETSNNVIANNLIVNPGVQYQYLPDSYNYINTKEGVDALQKNNFFSRYIHKDMFTDSVLSIYSSLANFSLGAKGTKIQEYGINFDFFNKMRPEIPSIGAFEYDEATKFIAVQRSDIKVLHNVATEVFMIENLSNENMHSINVFNMNGRKMYHVSINEPRFLLLNLKGILPVGIYILTVEKLNSVFKYKFIVNTL